MAMMQKIIVELSDADRRLLKRIAVALEGPLPPTFSGEPKNEVRLPRRRLPEEWAKDRQVRLEESAAAQEDDSVLFPTVGLDGVVRHV